MALINSYKGIIAGIGDKSINANEIPPEFDALIRHFVVGQDAVISGLYTNTDGSELTKGYCIAQGYIGWLKQDISFPAGSYVYGVFTVNHDKDVTDSFIIEVYDGEILNPRQDNILSYPGKYYFRLRPSQKRLYNPLKAEYANHALTVSSDGILEDGVEAFTQKVNDNSKKVATTEYVHNQIEEEINAKRETFTATIYSAISSASPVTITVNAIHKSKLCVITIDIIGPTQGSAVFYQGEILLTLHDPYHPSTEIRLDESNVHIAIKTDGHIALTAQSSFSGTYRFGNIGYETN